MITILLATVLALGCSGGTNIARPNPTPVRPASVPVYGYEIVKTYPHDGRAFTQGLFFHNGFLYESTGEEGESSIRKVEIETGKVLQKWDLPPEEFGEGVALLNGQIFQITWRDGICRVFGVEDLKLTREMRYQGEGWGITTDGKQLIVSDGTHILKFVEPSDFRSVRKLPVMQPNGKPLFLLNELEYVKGEVWANIWFSEETETNTTQGTFPNIGKPNYIARIDPGSGNVVGWIDLAGISPDDQQGRRANALNGIAYDAATDRIFVTGKNWKKLFEIKLKPPTQ